MNDKEWKYEVDKYYTKNYQLIKSWAYKYAIRFNYNEYAEDILNDMYLWLLKNKRREINIDKHILWYLSNMHFKNSETQQYNYNEKHINEITGLQIKDEEEIDDNYYKEYKLQLEINEIKEFYSTLTLLEKSIFNLYYKQEFNSIRKLAKHLNITYSYAYKYIKIIKKKINQWKKEKELN